MGGFKKGVSGCPNMKFKKGISGNPSGRPRGTGVNLLLEAIEKVEKSKNICFWDKVVEKSFVVPSIMIALIKKLVPDQTEGENALMGDYKITFVGEDEE